MYLLTTTPSAKTNATASPFLRLPGEIRNRIYKLVLTHEKPVMIWHIEPMMEDEHVVSQNIHGVCRQIYAETKTTFYAINTFRMTFEGLQTFSRRPEFQRAAVQHIQLVDRQAALPITDLGSRVQPTVWFYQSVYARASDLTPEIDELYEWNEQERAMLTTTPLASMFPRLQSVTLFAWRHIWYLAPKGSNWLTRGEVGRLLRGGNGQELSVSFEEDHEWGFGGVACWDPK